MTPAILAAKRAKVTFTVHEYTHDPSVKSYGEEAALKLGIDQSRVFKTLVVSIGDSSLAVVVIPVAKQLDLKLCAKAFGVKKVVMAEQKAVERSTGYVLGGVSPIGQKKRLVTLLDSSASLHETLFVSAGRRGLEIELSADDLCFLTDGRLADISK